MPDGAPARASPADAGAGTPLRAVAAALPAVSTAPAALRAGTVLGASVARLESGARMPPPATASAERIKWAPPPRVGIPDALLALAVQPALAHAAAAPPPVCAAGLAARAGALLGALVDNTLARKAAAGVSAVHASDTCVLCLESDPPPDTLFFPCGHQCVHWEEAARLDSCPLCRAAVSARLCVADGRFVSRPARAPFTPRDADAAEERGSFASSKPVIYLYPTQEMDVSVSVALAPSGVRFTTLVPTPTKTDAAGRAITWRVRATPDGTLDAALPEGYAAAWVEPGAASSSRAAATTVRVATLFWESDHAQALREALPLPPAACFCVPGAALGDWLLHALPRLGLAVREYTEMASFWAAKVGHHPFVLLRFASAEEMAAHVAALAVLPVPDVLIRVFLLCRGVAQLVAGAAAVLPAAADVAPRRGFTAVEWGGSEL
jgi:hypothetical protein